MLSQQTQQQPPRPDYREPKGAALYSKGHVCMGENSFYVQSETDLNIVYEVQSCKCECPDFERRLLPCKHVFAVEYFMIGGQNY